jgi:hypothetical protein
MKNTVINKKKNMLKGIIILFTILLIIPSCNEHFEEMNKNPNALTEVPDDFLFANLVRNVARERLDRWQQDFGAQYAHQAISNSWQKSIDQYLDSHQQGDIAEELFKGAYGNVIKYANEIVVMNSREGNTNEVRIAMAKTMAIVTFAKLTDYFGDVPYFEAGMGKYEILLPKYDEQKLIYADMVEQLEAFRTTIANANPEDGFSSQDPLFLGDLDKWERFVNSLRLRLAMRARFADPEKYNSIIGDCLTKPLMEDNSQNAKLEHWESDRGELYNPWHNLKIEYQSGTYQYNVSKKLVDWLVENNDPRLAALVKPNPEGDFVGMPNGLTDAALSFYVRSNISVPGDFMLNRNQPLDIMTASEIWFLRAEAALFNLGGGDENEFYQNGIKQAMARWEVDANEYITSSPLATLSGSDEEKFRQISEQMWVAFIPNHVEAWSNMRRTGYPVVERRTDPMLSKGVTDGYLPKRLIYPYTVEKSLNGDNMQKAIDRMGGNKIDIAVWWDVRD